MKMNDIIETVRQNEGSHYDADLRVGDVFEFEGREVVVYMVNDSRANCIGLGSRPVSFKHPITGEEKKFEGKRTETFGISPNSEVQILRRLGKQGLIELLESNKKGSGSSMSKEGKTEKKEKSDKPKLGRLGGFMGFPITAVIRAMAKAGWDYWEVRHVFDAEKIAVADNTIRIQLSAGRNGQGGDPADISKKKLEELRPDESEKPARASATPSKKGKEEAPVKGKKKKSKPAPADDEDEDEEEAPAKGKKTDDDEDGPDAEDGQ